MNDNFIMPYGKHKGKAMANVPGGYLLYLWHDKYQAVPTHKLDGVGRYIKDNLADLQRENKPEFNGTL